MTSIRVKKAGGVVGAALVAGACVWFAAGTSSAPLSAVASEEDGAAVASADGTVTGAESSQSDAAAASDADDGAATQALIESALAAGMTYEDLNNAGISVILDEGGKTLYDPHNGHVDFDCTDCHQVASAAQDADAGVEADDEQAGSGASDAAATDANDGQATAEASAAASVTVTGGVLACNTCHTITLPDGWSNPQYSVENKPFYVDPGKIYGDLGYGTSGPSYGMGSAEADGE